MSKVMRIIKNVLSTLIVFLFEAYKLIMGSLLIVFTPQYCNNQITTVCSVGDNVKWSNDLYNTTLVINFITLSVFITICIFEYVRENILLDNLKFNHENCQYDCVSPKSEKLTIQTIHANTISIFTINVSETLTSNLNKLFNDKNLIDTIIRIQQSYKVLALVGLFIYILNIILSVIIISEKYFGVNTTLSFILSILFMIGKVKHIYTIGTHNFLISSYKSIPYEFNDKL